MPEPRIKRYALVPSAGHDGVTRFHLARVASRRGAPAAERLERMEEIAALERRGEPPSATAGRPPRPSRRAWRAPRRGRRG